MDETTLVAGDEHAGARTGGVVLDAGPTTRVEFVRVDYDIEEATRGILASELPADFADYLRTGGKRVPATSG